MFPGLAEMIFNSLDDKNLVYSKTVSRSWSAFTNNEVFYPRRIITKLIGGYEDFKDTWKLVMKKADKEMMNELALAVKYFLSKHPGDCYEENCKHRALPRSPLHIAAEAGQVSLCEFILKITEDKNPKLKNLKRFDSSVVSAGWTPLHEAALGGHLLICSLIMDEIQDKNPGDDKGFTPLHAAAGGGQLETFKMIMKKAGTDLNPSDNLGWTPLHSAASEGQLEICNFMLSAIKQLKTKIQ
jgi:ankyrin repeat protein